MERQPDVIGSGWFFPLRVNQRGGIDLARDITDIEQAMAIILSTPRGYRLMRPEFGSRLHELVFAPINGSTMALARHYVQEALGYWEPRIEVQDVLTTQSDDPLGYRLLITVVYRIKATHDERALVYPFYTIPDEE